MADGTMLEALRVAGVTLPLTVGAEGRELLVVDVNRERLDREADFVARAVALMINSHCLGAGHA